MEAQMSIKVHRREDSGVTETLLHSSPFPSKTHSHNTPHPLSLCPFSPGEGREMCAARPWTFTPAPPPTSHIEAKGITEAYALNQESLKPEAWLCHNRVTLDNFIF